MKRFWILLIAAMLGLVLACGNQEAKAPAKPAAPPEKAEKSAPRNEARQWYQQIPCRGGAFIGLYSETPPTFQLSTPRAQNAKNIWQQIKHKPGCRADFHFDGEAILFFPPEQLDVVAEGAGARVKRQGRPMTPEQKAKLAEMGREALKKLREATSQTPQTDPNSNDRPVAMV